MDKTEVTRSTAQPTWFFERGDGFIFACEEREAWDILHNKGNWERKDFKMLGMSDGKTYREVTRNSAHELASLKEQKASIQNTLQRYIDTEEKLRFEDLLGDEDPKIVRVTQLLDEQRAKLEDVNGQINNISSVVIKKAFDAELEVARGNMTMPRNFDVITPSERDRADIMANLPRR